MLLMSWALSHSKVLVTSFGLSGPQSHCLLSIDGLPASMARENAAPHHSGLFVFGDLV